MNRLLLTGATGFLGTHCLKRAEAAGFEIHAVNRAGAGPTLPKVMWHAADLRDPIQAVALVERIQPSHVLHVAWSALPLVYVNAPDNRDWLKAGLAMVKAFGDRGGKRFVAVGSSAEYAKTSMPCIEDETPIAPASLYGESKVAFWNGLQAAAEEHGFSTAWGRVFLPYGPGDTPPRLIPSIIESLRAKQVFTIKNSSGIRDFIYSLDVADLLVSILTSTATGAFNVGTGEGTTIRTVAQAIADKLHASDRVSLEDLERPASDPPMLIADMSKVRKKFGWMPSMPLMAGLDRVIAL